LERPDCKRTSRRKYPKGYRYSSTIAATTKWCRSRTDLLALADHVSGYTAVIANLSGAERREADWRGFCELVRDLARGSEDAFAVVRWLRRLLEAEAEVPRLPLEAGAAVTLTMAHGSKGLEWPVVVLPGLDCRMPTRSDSRSTL
jgi:ATP-dependent helicase/nuclease subunit A